MKNAPLNTTLLDRAIVFAVKAHQGTERRMKGYPYVVHPLEAIAITATMTNDQELLAAAALHDTVEDTDVTLDNIRQEFGDRVADLVMSETDITVAPDGTLLTWKERKQRDMDNLSKASRDVKIVTLGDKLSNLRGIARDYAKQGDQVWQMFHEKEKAMHAWRFRGLRDALSELSDTSAFKEYDLLVKQVFDENKQ